MVSTSRSRFAHLTCRPQLQNSGLWIERSWWGSQPAAIHLNTPRLHLSPSPHLAPALPEAAACPSCHPAPSLSFLLPPLPTYPHIHSPQPPIYSSISWPPWVSGLCQIVCQALGGGHMSSTHGPCLEGEMIRVQHDRCRTERPVLHWSHQGA